MIAELTDSIDALRKLSRRFIGDDRKKDYRRQLAAKVREGQTYLNDPKGISEIRKITIDLRQYGLTQKWELQAENIRRAYQFLDGYVHQFLSFPPRVS